MKGNLQWNYDGHLEGSTYNMEFRLEETKNIYEAEIIPYGILTSKHIGVMIWVKTQEQSM